MFFGNAVFHAFIFTVTEKTVPQIF